MPPNERFKFEREVSQLELKVLRNWEDIGDRNCWKGLPNDTVARIRLLIHELFALHEWRKRDGGKELNVIDITDSNKEEFVQHLAVAKEFLTRGRKKVEKIEDGPVKEEMLKGLGYSEAWYEEIRTKIE